MEKRQMGECVATAKNNKRERESFAVVFRAWCREKRTERGGRRKKIEKKEGGAHL
jgi:hypothetical protein